MIGFANRLLSACVVLFIIPGVTVKLLGFSIRNFGVAVPRTRRPLLLLTILLSCGVGLGIVSAQMRPLQTYYPLAHSLVDYANSHGLWSVMLYGTVYLFLFYIPWEIFFRGILILPFISDLAEGDGSGHGAHIISIAAFQAIPSALLHFGHPASETFGALVFGLIAGYVVVKTRSILPSLAFHAATGIALDVCLVIQHLH